MLAESVPKKDAGKDAGVARKIMRRLYAAGVSPT